MSQQRVKDLLKELQSELAVSEGLDEETLALARQLDKEIDDLIAESEAAVTPELESAIALEARFAATHPVAERIIRELIATLGRMGV